MRRDGTHLHRVTQKGASVTVDSRWEDHAPAWSPNGRQLAFERFDRKRDRQAVFTMHREGTSLKRITPWWLGASQPDYSPNGHWILVRTHESSDTSGNLMLIARTGLQRHKVTHDPAGTAKWQSASFSPDGKKIQAGRTPIVGGEQQPGTDVGQCGWMAPTCTTSRRHPASGRAHPTGGPGRNHTIPDGRARLTQLNPPKARPLRRAFVDAASRRPSRCVGARASARAAERRRRGGSLLGGPIESPWG